MNNFEMKILCGDCPNLNLKIVNSGSMFGVQFVSFETEKKYIIIDNPDISWNSIMRERENFTSTYVPKFGKYEIEHFIGYKLMEALFITKDITELLNCELLCNDFPYNVIKVRADILKKRILQCFEEVDGDCDNPNIVFLMFKWKTYSELKEE